MNAQESDFDQLVAGLTVLCEGTDDGKFSCKNDAEWHLDYHGCNEELLCEGHASAYVSQLIYLLSRYGSAVCSKCEKTSYKLTDHIRVVKV